MSANVETMFSVRETPWHGLGIIVQEAPTSAEALRLAGLDWEVEGKPIYDADGNVISGYVANTRDSDGSILGVVGTRYSIVQNTDAFDFTDSLVADGQMKYETAGSLKNGKQIWLLGKLGSFKMLDDDIDPYLCFMNTHDGSGAVKVCVTPTRVVCANTLNLALRTAKRNWSARHTGSIQNKLTEARTTLGLAQKYQSALIQEAENIVTQLISDMELERIFDQLYFKDDMTELQQTRFEDLKEDFFLRYAAPDVRPYRGTKYGALMAVTDFVDHREPVRNTANYKENQFKKIVEGHSEVDAFYELLTA